MYVLAGAKPEVLTASGTAIWRRGSPAGRKGDEPRRCPFTLFYVNIAASLFLSFPFSCHAGILFCFLFCILHMFLCHYCLFQQYLRDTETAGHVPAALCHHFSHLCSPAFPLFSGYILSFSLLFMSLLFVCCAVPSFCFILLSFFSFLLFLFFMSLLSALTRLCSRVCRLREDAGKWCEG